MTGILAIPSGIAPLHATLAATLCEIPAIGRQIHSIKELLKKGHSLLIKMRKIEELLAMAWVRDRPNRAIAKWQSTVGKA